MKQFKYLAIVILSGLLFTGCDKGSKVSFKTEKTKYSYAIGYQIATNLKRQKLDVDSKALAAAFKDVLSGKKTQLSEEDMQAAIKKMSEEQMKKMTAERAKMDEKAKANVEIGKKFLAENKAKKGIVTTASGLQYKMLKEGTGKKPTPSDVVKVHYKGTLIDGTKFDSSYDRKAPAEFPVGAVIKGWTEALQLMKVGSKAQLFIPSELAYGEKGNPSIPGNSVLVFDVELLDIVKKDVKK